MATSYEITGQYLMLPDNVNEPGWEYSEPVWSGATYPDELDLELARIIALSGTAKLDQVSEIHRMQGVLPIEGRIGIHPTLEIRRIRSIMGVRQTKIIGTLPAVPEYLKDVN